MRKCVLAFVGQVVPDLPEYDIPGFGRAGNLAQIGFLDALNSAGVVPNLVLSGQPIAYYPKGNIIARWAHEVQFGNGIKVKLIPLINIYIIRDVLRAIYIYIYIICWGIKHFRDNRIILTYNLNVPPILPLLVVARLTGARLVSILYDVAWPESLTLGFVREFAYKTLIKISTWCIPRLDGRIVITNSISERYAPNEHALLVDGGVTDLVIGRLFPLKIGEEKKEIDILFAGGLDEWNHIPLLLEMMNNNQDNRCRLWLVGDGRCRNKVIQATKVNARIRYFGVLGHHDLFQLYQKADILLNIRNTSDPAMKYHFPSKLLEILTVGKPVITTSIAHAAEEYGRYCFILDEETPQALFERIQAIMALSPEERLAFGLRARDYMLREHTWKRQGEKIRAYLEQEVLGEKIESQRRGEKS
jgi:hypothetical protein